MRITVFQQHTHKGIIYPAGSEVDLPDADAQWLIGIEGARRAGLILSSGVTKADVASVIEVPATDVPVADAE